MAYLFTGKGTSGSWQIRGQQMAQGIGAAIPHCTDPKGFDAAVVVKRTPSPVIQSLRDYSIPWVWDIVDAYPQPAANGWTRAEAVHWIRYQVAQLRPDGIIWPNRKMMEDAEIDIPQTVLYHHYRPDMRLNPIRKTIQTVGYEGGPYLGRWADFLKSECQRRGWQFVVNPGELASLDVVVALRDPSGYVPFSYKSNVKLANAHGSGTPFIGSPENGYIETQSGAEYWATTRQDVLTAFDWLEDQSAREQIHDRFRDASYSLEQAQQDLTEFLCRFK